MVSRLSDKVRFPLAMVSSKCLPSSDDEVQRRRESCPGAIELRLFIQTIVLPHLRSANRYIRSGTC